jgi:hypothetical protein
MKYPEKAKINAKKFAPFAGLWMRRLAAVFSGYSLTAVMLIAAMFFASCGSSDDSGNLLNNLVDPPPPPADPVLSISADSSYILTGGQTGVTVKAGGLSMSPALTGLQVTGGTSEDTRIAEGVLYAGADEGTCVLTITSALYPDLTTSVKVIAASYNPEVGGIKEKFGVTAKGIAGVTAVFKALSAFIENDGLSNYSNVIKPGDWIDLEGGLIVQDYEGSGGFTYTGADPNTRLMVVGIDSFRTRNILHGETQITHTYQGSEAPPPHIVFQFKDIPVSRRMNPTDTNNGGYPVSEMRKYLNGDGMVGGNFLDGLVKAGVPEDVLWAPTRAVFKVNELGADAGLEKIQDTLWLPTECEVRADGGPGYSYEKPETQAFFDYYASDSKLSKGGGVPYWLATASWFNILPHNGYTAFRISVPSSYTNVASFGNVKAATGYGDGQIPGVAPAFCIQ